MNTNKKIAVVIGVLFLVALIFNIIASGLMDPVLSVPDYLVNAYPRKNAVILGNMLNFICAIAMIFIPIVFFPIANKINKNLGLGYVVFRFLEGILQIFIAIKYLSLIGSSREYLNAGPGNIPFLQSIGDSIQSEIHWAEIIYVMNYIGGAMAFYPLLYKSKLVPRFLSVWGILAVLLLLIGEIMGIFGLGIFSTMPLMKAFVYFAPLVALNELVLSIWLIAKGFNSPAINPVKLQAMVTSRFDVLG